MFRTEFFFRTKQELEHFLFLSRKTRNFFPKFNSRLYDKSSESDYFFFPPPKSEYFFQQHWESEYFFRKKTITPPLQVKWSFPKRYDSASRSTGTLRVIQDTRYFIFQIRVPGGHDTTFIISTYTINNMLYIYFYLSYF